VIADAVGCILLASITLYAVFGGADFGAGLWDLLAGTTRRGRPPRALIEESITPVWEANHVWLIFDLVIFWTAFPTAFAAVMNTAALPLWLAAAGVLLRGAGFAFRKEIDELRWQRAAGATFAISSLLTPFFMGTVVGAIATGQVPAAATHARTSAWTNSTSLLLGCLFVAACGYLAAVFLVAEAASRADHHLEVYFSRRARAAGLVAGALSLATLVDLHSTNHALYHRLTDRALPLVILAALCGLIVVAKPQRRFGARVVAATGVAAVVWGWGVAQYPTLLPGTAITLSNAGAPHTTLVTIVVLFAAVALVIGPSLVLLLELQRRHVLAEPSAGAGPPGPAARPYAGDQTPSVQ
jgi:cytochrome d ubiquinol oxidase subunit II